jgi:hypothetical protein
MNLIKGRFTRFGAIALAAVCAAPVPAQTPEVKEKPPQYSYVSFWNIPRSQWPEMAKADAADKPIFDKALADGTIIGYGNDANLLHRPDGETHADWWSSMSIAGLLKVLDRLRSSGNAESPALQSATNHSDEIVVSRYYNWRSGSWQRIYTRGAFYKLKPNAPKDAVEMLSKNVLAPVLEKLFADGTIVQYEIDTEAMQTADPAGSGSSASHPTPKASTRSMRPFTRL